MSMIGTDVLGPCSRILLTSAIGPLPEKPPIFAKFLKVINGIEPIGNVAKHSHLSLCFPVDLICL